MPQTTKTTLPMNIRICTHDTDITIYLSGSLSGSSYINLRQKFDMVLRTKFESIYVDLSKVEDIDCSGLSPIIGLYRETILRQKGFAIQNLSVTAAKIFEDFNLINILPIQREKP